MRTSTKALKRLFVAAMAVLMSQGMMAGGFSYTYGNVAARAEIVPEAAGIVYLIGGDPDNGSTLDPEETMFAEPAPTSEIMYTTHTDGEGKYADENGSEIKVTRFWLTVQVLLSDSYKERGYVFKGLTDVYRPDGAYKDADFYRGKTLKDLDGNTIKENPLIRDTVNADDKGGMLFTINVNKSGALRGLASAGDYKDNSTDTADEQARKKARNSGGWNSPIPIYAVFVRDKSTGVKDVITSEVKADAPVYNAAGQRVGESYKGVVIKNGTKQVRR